MTLEPEVVEQPPEGEGLGHEVKFDGYRTQLIKDVDAATSDAMAQARLIGRVKYLRGEEDLRHASLRISVKMERKRYASGFSPFRGSRR